MLRSVAARGLIAALGIHHAAQAGHFALADDLVEPLRPFIDARIMQFLKGRNAVPSVREWAPDAAGVLTAPIRGRPQRVRLLYAIDLYVESFASAIVRKNADLLWFPKI